MSNRVISQTRIVLVEPADSLNIGAVARAMMNLGFEDLALVQPQKYRPKKAAVTACWASSIVERAEIFDSLSASLVDFERVTGFTARDGKNRPSSFLLPQWGEALAAAPRARIALVFGPEDSGLRQEHLDLCSELVRIPSSDLNPSFNLAQAALLAMYEIVRGSAVTRSAGLSPELPSAQELRQLDTLLFETMQLSGFTHASSPPGIPSLLGLTLRRALPTRRELSSYLGFFSRIKASLKQLEKK